MAANPFDLIDPPVGEQAAPTASVQGGGGGKVVNPFDAIDPSPEAVAKVQASNAPYSPVQLTPQALARLPMADQLKRSMGLAGRDLATAWTSLPMTVADAAVGASNMLTGQKNPSTSQQFQQFLTQLGLPVPQTTSEKVGNMVATMVAGGAEPSMRALQAGATALGPKQPFPSTVPGTNEFGSPIPSQVKANTIKEATDLGYISTPTISDSGPTARAAEALANKNMIEQGAMKQNQTITDQVSRRIVGLPENAPLEQDTVANAISKVWEKGYKPIEDLPVIPTTSNFRGELYNISRATQGTIPNPAIGALLRKYNVQSFTGENAIKDIRELRADASKLYQSSDVGSEGLAKAYSMLASNIENNIQEHLSNIGQSGSEMLDAFKAARTTMAQQYAIKDSIVKGTGSVDASKLAVQLQRGAPFTGDLLKMANFANAAPQLVKSPAASEAPLFSNMERAAGMFGFGALGHGNFGAAAAGLGYPSTALGIRQLLKSPYGQSLIAPHIGPGIGSRAAQLPYLQNAIPTAFNLGSGLFGQ